MAYRIAKPSVWTPSMSGHYAFELAGDLFSVLSDQKIWSFSSIDDNTMRFEVRAGDTFWWDAAYGDAANRSEIADTTLIKDGTPLDISYQFKLEPGAPNTARWMVIGQLHQDTNTNGAPWSPPFAIGMQGEKMTIVINKTGADGKPVSVQLFTDVTDIQRDHYYDIEIKAIVDPWGNGRLVVTRDGVMLTDYSGPLGYTSETGVNWKEGLYRANNATESIAADYRNLSITTGGAVTFPDKSAFIAAPVLSVSSVSNNADGSRTINVTGTAKAETTVSIFENGIVVGTAATDANGAFSSAVNEMTGGQHLLSAIATEATGKVGLTAAVMAVEIGTAADIVARMPSIAAENVGAIVLTDTNVLTVTSAVQMSTIMNSNKAALAKIQGPYSFLLTSKVIGQAYDTQTCAYTSSGALTDRIRYAAGKVVFDEVSASDGSKVVKSLNSLGGWDVATITSDSFQTTFSRNTASGVPSFFQTFSRDGSTSIHYYNGAGQETNFTTTNADKSRTSVLLGITGQSYAIQAFSFDTTGKMTLQQRFTASGVLIWQTATSPSGTCEISNYDPVSGRETSYTILNTDGSKIQGTFGIVGRSYTAQVVSYNSAGQITGQTTSNAAGPIPSPSSLILGAMTPSSSLPPSASPATGYTRTNSDGSSTVGTYQPGSTSLLASVKFYNAAGTLTEDDSYNAPGQKIATHVFDAGGDLLTTVDPSTGFATRSVQTKKDGSSVISTFQSGSGTLIRGVKTFDAAGTLTEADSYNAAGQKIATDVFRVGGDLLTTLDPSSGLATRSVQTNADGSSVVTSFQPGSGTLIAGVKSYNAAGALVETDVYNALGQRISADVFLAAGGDVLTTFDPSTGAATGSVQTSGGVSGNGLSTTFDPVTGVRTSTTQINADGSKVVSSYLFGSGTLLASVQIYSAGGALLETDGFNQASAKISTDIYSADNSHVLTTYDPGGPVTSTVQVKANLARFVTTFAAGSPGRITSVSSFNAAGLLVAAETWESDGSHKVYGFDPKTGLKNGYALTGSDGSKTVTTFRPGNEAMRLSSQLYNATGQLIETDGFNAAGQKTSAIMVSANGARATATYSATSGALLTSSTYNVDGTRTDQNNAVVGKSYTQQIATYQQRTGALVSMSRYHGDANHTLAFSQSVNKDGSSVVSNFDQSGREVCRLMTASDGSRDVISSSYSGARAAPSTIQQDHFNSSNQKLWTDLTNPDGSHKQTAFTSGVTLTSRAAGDTFTSAAAGGDTFVFKPAFGQDIVTNFHGGSGLNHDILDLRSLAIPMAPGQSSLQALAQCLTNVGRDAVLTLTPTDSITLRNTVVPNLTAADFWL